MPRHLAILLLLTLLPFGSLGAGTPVAGSADRQAAASPVVSAITTRPDALRVRVLAPGRQTVDRPALVAAGWPESTDLTRVAVWQHDQPLPRRVQGTAIQFVTTPNESPFTTETVVWLTRESALVPDAILPVADAPLALDADTLWSPDAPSGRGGGDAWYLAEVRLAAPTASLALTTPVALPIGTEVQIALTTTSPGPHVLTGDDLAPLIWSGTGPQTITTTLRRALPAGATTLTLATGLTRLLIDAVRFPTVRVAWPAPPAPLIQTGFGPRLPILPGGGIMLAPPVWHAALAPLIADMEFAGEAVTLLDPQQAYDAFSGGERHPHAIRALFQQTRPRLGVLVGATSAQLREHPDDPLPPYLIARETGVVACEWCFARLDGSDPTADPLPDMAITRWPVTSADETAALVTRILTERSAPLRAGAGTAILLTDNDVQADGTPDSAGSFLATARVARQALGDAWTIQPFAYDPRPSAPLASRDVAALRVGLFDAWDAGAGLLVYVGHASWWQWGATDGNAATPYLTYLYDADARAIQGARPIILSMTCRSADVSVPYLESMDARLVRQGAAIASVGFSGDGVNTGHARLLARLVPRLRAGERLGAAVQAAIREVVAAGETSDMIWTISVQGDADARLWPVADRVLLPVIAGGPP